MKLWTTGYVDASIGPEFRIAMNHVETQVNAFLATFNAGEGLDTWDVAYLILEGEDKQNNERMSYKPKNRSAEIYIKIDFCEFQNSDQKGKRKLMIQALISSIQKLIERYKLNGFNFKELINWLENFKSNEL